MIRMGKKYDLHLSFLSCSSCLPCVLPRVSFFLHSPRCGYNGWQEAREKEKLMRIVTVSQMRDLERQTDAAGHSYAEMMEQAGRSVAEAVHRRIGRWKAFRCWC